MSLVDCGVVFSRVCYTYWSAFCNNIKIVNNVQTLDIGKVEVSKLNTNNILWLARVSSEKMPEQALQILKLVVAKIPDAKMHFVGGKGDSDPYIIRLKKYATANSLTQNVDFVDFTNDVASYYQQSDVMLITSRNEGWCNSLMEALMHGLPIVCYDMPYLELLRKNSVGSVVVPQQDIVAAAEAIINILTDRAKLSRMGKASRELAVQMSKYDLKEAWQDIFDSLTEGRASAPPYIPTEEDRKIMVRTLNDHSKGIYDKIVEHRSYKREVKKMSLEIARLNEEVKSFEFN
jgi:glycosyltransferase involved in cell wall biosynthesis